jgi:hypothetical protein
MKKWRSFNSEDVRAILGDLRNLKPHKFAGIFRKAASLAE